jgi:hypothetical protein
MGNMQVQLAMPRLPHSMRLRGDWVGTPDSRARARAMGHVLYARVGDWPKRDAAQLSPHVPLRRRLGDARPFGVMEVAVEDYCGHIAS